MGHFREVFCLVFHVQRVGWDKASPLCVRMVQITRSSQKCYFNLHEEGKFHLVWNKSICSSTLKNIMKTLIQWQKMSNILKYHDFQKNKNIYVDKQSKRFEKSIFPTICNSELSWRTTINTNISFLALFFLYWCINGPYLFKMTLQHNFIEFHTTFSFTHSAVKISEQKWCKERNILSCIAS